MLQMNIKGKAFASQVMKTQTGDGMLGFDPYFDIRHNYDGTVSSTHWPQFTPKEIPWYSILLRGQVDPMATE
jgi:hypothetical protein